MHKIKKNLGALKKTTKVIVLKTIKIKSAKIPYLISFPRKIFNKNKNHILNKISKNFKNKVAVRSSSILEDQKKKSYAGHFKSFLNIDKKYDDFIRSKNLLYVLKNFEKLKPMNQKVNDIIPYYVMHPVLRSIAFKK